MKKLLKLDSFWLRVIALVTMTIDHIGVCLSTSDSIPLRIVGRLALPIFIFLTVEGALKTSNKKKYILRLSGMAVFVSIALLVLVLMDGFYTSVAFTSGNIFFDLLLIVLCITILESNSKKIKPLIALPILYSIFCFIVVRIEGCGCNGNFYWLFPSFRMQYSIYSMMLGFGYYFAKKFSNSYVNKYAPMYIEDKEYIQTISNIFSAVVIILATTIFYLLNISFGEKYANPLDGLQTYAIVSCLFILLYNGKKGYNAKWFKVAYYLYYPAHIGIIALVFYLIGVAL